MATVYNLWFANVEVDGKSRAEQSKIRMGAFRGNGRAYAAREVFPEIVPQEPIATDAAVTEIEHKENQFGRVAPELTAEIQGTTLSFGNMHSHGRLCINYLRARRRVFIDLKGWELPQTDGMEFDQYDTPECRWVVIHE